MSTNTEVEVGTLSVDDVAALRIAETVSFHVHKGETYINASIDVQRVGEPRIFTAREQRVLPQADDWNRKRHIPTGGGARGYDGDSSWRGDERTTAFEMVHSARYSDTWKTIVSLLKVGDVLSLDFCGDGGSNGNTKPYGIHVDTLHLNVRRGDQRLRFLVDFSACVDNSARAVKRFG
jgi:hypothetical protein